MALLSIKNVGKHFDGNVVLESIDLDLEGGRIYQLIGPNGSGKTTLVNVISGVLKPNSGTIIFDGHDITGMEPHQIYEYGLVRSFQIPQPFVNLNVNENLMTATTENPGDKYRNAPARPKWVGTEKSLQKKADNLMDMVNLGKVTNNLSSNLSGGQMKLLELGRIMMSGAKMIFMDEPIAGVNPKLAHDIFEKDQPHLRRARHYLSGDRAPAGHLVPVRGLCVRDQPGQDNSRGNPRRDTKQSGRNRVVLGGMTGQMSGSQSDTAVAPSDGPIHVERDHRSGEVVIQAEKLEAGFGKSHILFGINFEAHEHDITVIVGPNGCGKSTLLKSIFGLTTVYSGEIKYGGKNITGLPPHMITRQKIAYLPQVNNVFVNLTIRENLLMASYLMSKKEFDGRLPEVFETFPILAKAAEQKVSHAERGTEADAGDGDGDDAPAQADAV